MAYWIKVIVLDLIFSWYKVLCSRNFPHNLRLDGGSDWVVVHRDLANFALAEDNVLAHQLRLLFTTILLPLEGFFHTVSFNF